MNDFICRYRWFIVGKIAKKTVSGSACLLIRHSKYSKKYTPTDCFFGVFAHWDVLLLTVMHGEEEWGSWWRMRKPMKKGGADEEWGSWWRMGKLMKNGEADEEWGSRWRMGKLTKNRKVHEERIAYEERKTQWRCPVIMQCYLYLPYRYLLKNNKGLEIS